MRNTGFSARTVFIPLLFLFIHIMTISMVSSFFVVAGMMGLLLDTSANAFTLAAEITARYMGWIAITYSLIQILIYSMWLRRNQRKEYPIYVFQRKGKTGHWIAGAAIIIGILGFSMIQFSWMEVIAGFNRSWNTYLENYNESMQMLIPSQNIWMEILYLVILIPIAEELLFRGIIMAEFKRVMPAWTAILINGLLFGIFHWSPVQSVYTVVAGIAIAAIYMWSESLLMAIGMHALFNFFGGIVPTAAADNPVIQGIVVIAELAFVFIGILAAVWFYLNRRYQGEGDYFETKRISTAARTKKRPGTGA